MLGLDETETLILSIAAIVFTTIVAGCVSGLTLSLFSLDETYLKALADGPESAEKRQAARVLAVINSPHWLLVTLLLTNAAAIESMPMIIDSILNPVAAICISVVLVLVFGEVIPQAFFIRHALPIGSFFSYPLRGLMWVTSPISWTVAKVLDAVVGHREAVFFRRRELREFLMLQQEMLEQPLLHSEEDGKEQSPQAIAAQDMKQKISEQEIAIMLGALSLSETMVIDVLKTRIEDVASLSEDDVVDKNRCENLFTCGFSRILVHEPGNREHVTGFFVTKMLITLIYRTQDRAPKVKDLVLLQPHICSPYDLLSEVYQQLQLKSCHLAVVCEEGDYGGHRKAIGIITAHDILEFIHRRSFGDETDLRQGAPMQLLVKSWYQMQFRKQVISSANMFGGTGPPSGGAAAPQSMRPTDALFLSPGYQTSSAQWDQSPSSQNRSFTRLMLTRQSGGGGGGGGSARNRSKTGEREMLRKPSSPTTRPSGSTNTSGYGSLA